LKILCNYLPGDLWEGFHRLISERLVVGPALARFTQDVRRRLDRLKERGVTARVGMVFAGKFPVSGLDFLAAGVCSNAERLVVGHSWGIIEANALQRKRRCGN